MVGPFCVLLALPSSESSNLDGLAQAIAHTLPASISPASPNSPPCLSLSATSVPPALTSPLPHIFPSSRDSTATCPRSSAHSTLVTKLHPWASILGQGLFGILFVFLAQPGTSVNGAYNVLVAIAVVISMVPFMFLFASLIRLQREPVAPDVLRVPGGRPVAILLGSIGFLTCAFATVLSLLPAPEEPHKLLYLLKIFGSTGALIALGVLVFYLGSRRAHPST